MKAALIVSMVCLGLLSAVGRADVCAAAVALDIPEQPLPDALNALARQTGLQVIFPAPQVRGATAPRVAGLYTPQAALDLLLSGTRLAYEFIDERTVAIRVRPADAGAAAPPQADAAPGAPAPTRISLVESAPPVEDPQPAAAPPAAPVERNEGGAGEVVVTGSRLRQATPTSRVTVITRADIELRSFQSVEEALGLVLQNNSGVQSIATGSNFDTGIGFNNYNRAVSPDLRGLGPGATLTLLNGHPLSPSAIAQGGANFSDIAGMPAQVIERIEVFTDSGSAIYGTDAIAGVTNIVTRRDYTGLSLDGAYNGNGRGGAIYNLGLLGGAAGAGWNIMGALNYRETGATTFRDLDRSNRDYTARSGRDYRPAVISPGQFESFAGPLPGTAATLVRILPGARDTLTLAEVQPGELPDDDVDELFSPHGEDYSLYAYGAMDLPRGVELSVRLLAARRETRFDRGPQAIAPNIFFGSTPFDPFPAPWFGLFQYEFVNETAAGLLPRQSREDRTDNLNALGALSGAVSDWRWDLSVAVSQEDTATRNHTYNQALTAAALAGTINVVSDGSTATAADFAGLQPDDPFLADMSTGVLSVNGYAQGDIFRLPAGAVRALLGAEYRRDDARTRGVDLSQGIGTNIDLIGTAARDVQSVFGELAIPVVGAANAMPGVDGLLFTAAARHADNSDFGGETVYRFGLSWEAAPWLRFRASRGTSFRAPSLFEINEPQQLMPNIMTPDFGCPQALAGGPPCFGFADNIFGGNPEVRAETGRSWTAGVEIAPAFVEGLAFGAGVQDVDFEDRIVSPLGSFGLEFVTANSGLFPGIVQRDGAGNLVSLSDSPINLERTHSRAWDFWGQYAFANGAGRYSFSYAASHQAELAETILPGQAPLELAGTSLRGPDWRHRVSGQFTPAAWPRLQLAVDFNHLHAYTHQIGALGRDGSDAIPGAGNQRVGSFGTVNLYLSLELDGGSALTDGWRMSVAINNLFGAGTPFFDSEPGFDRLSGNPFGRAFSVSVGKAL
jgi:outer membrane receptor protein involved in Fe transport